MYTGSPSTCTTRPSMAGKADTTSCSMRLKVAPTWSARPPAAELASAAISASPVMKLKDHRGLVNTKDLPERVADLPEGNAYAYRIENEGHQVVAPAGYPLDSLEGSPPRGVARLPQAPQPIREGATHRGVDLEEITGRRLVHHELVDPHHHARFRFELLLVAIGRLLDLPLHERDGAHRAAEPVDLADVGLRLFLDPPGQGLHGVGTSQRIRGVGYPRLVGQHLLRAQGNAHRGLGG